MADQLVEAGLISEEQKTDFYGNIIELTSRLEKLKSMPHLNDVEEEIKDIELQLQQIENMQITRTCDKKVADLKLFDGCLLVRSPEILPPVPTHTCFIIETSEPTDMVEVIFVPNEEVEKFAEINNLKMKQKLLNKNTLT